MPSDSLVGSLTKLMFSVTLSTGSLSRSLCVSTRTDGSVADGTSFSPHLLTQSVNFHFDRPFKITSKGGKPQIQVQTKGETKSYSPEEISAMILTKMKETAEAYLGQKVTHAVVTVPACTYFVAKLRCYFVTYLGILIQSLLPLLIGPHQTSTMPSDKRPRMLEPLPA